MVRAKGLDLEEIATMVANAIDLKEERQKQKALVTTGNTIEIKEGISGAN